MMMMMIMYLEDHHQYKNHVQNLAMMKKMMNLVTIEKRLIQENKSAIQNNVMIEIMASMTIMVMILMMVQADEHHHQLVKQLLVILHIDLIQELMEMLMMIYVEQTERNAVFQLNAFICFFFIHYSIVLLNV
jgi:glycerol uptake facilitator-like aquaporin